MKKDTRPLLMDVVKYLDYVEEFSKEGYEAYIKDIRTQLVLQKTYEIIGEIVKRFSFSFREEYSDVEWQSLASFRDFLAHHYENIEHRYVWKAVEQMPAVREKVKRILETDQNLDRFDEPHGKMADDD